MIRKKGQLETLVLVAGFVIIITSVFIGGVYSDKVISKYRYVGDKEIKIVYDLSTCDISNLEKSNKLFFDNLNEAIAGGYNEANCNP